MSALSKAATDVLAERRRQIQVKGWTPEHDDKHSDCELAAAAAVYAVCYSQGSAYNLTYSGAQLWPSRWTFNDDGYRGNLVKAGALILAEIERLDRAEGIGSGA